MLIELISVIIGIMLAYVLVDSNIDYVVYERTSSEPVDTKSTETIKSKLPAN